MMIQWGMIYNNLSSLLAILNKLEVQSVDGLQLLAAIQSPNAAALLPLALTYPTGVNTLSDIELMLLAFLFRKRMLFIISITINRIPISIFIYTI